MIEPNADFRVESAVIISVGRHKSRLHPLFEIMLMKKLLFLLILPFLVVGCGSGSASSGSGGPCVVTDSGLEVCAISFFPDNNGGAGGTVSRDVDIGITICPDEEMEPLFVRRVGALVVRVRDVSTTGNVLTRKSVTLTGYTMSYSRGNPDIPARALVPFRETAVLDPGEMRTFGPTLLDLAQIFGLFPVVPLVPVNYNATVTFSGLDRASGESFRISASTEFALGNFNLCM